MTGWLLLVFFLAAVIGPPALLIYLTLRYPLTIQGKPKPLPYDKLCKGMEEMHRRKREQARAA